MARFEPQVDPEGYVVPVKLNGPACVAPIRDRCTARSSGVGASPRLQLPHRLASRASVLARTCRPAVAEMIASMRRGKLLLLGWFEAPKGVKHDDRTN